MAFPLFRIIAMLVSGIIAATVGHLAAGVTLNTGVIEGPVAGFDILGVVTVRLVVAILRNIAEAPASSGPTVER